MAGFWDNDNPSEFEQLEETIDSQAQNILDEMNGLESSDEEYEEEYMDDYISTNEVAYKLNQRESNVVSESMIRLEQARLYDMLIKHDLFAGVKAHPKALKNVQDELKSYIVDRLEILLGIKQEEVEKQPEQIVVESPFNDLEIEFLKALSLKGTLGASGKTNQKKKLVANKITPLVEEVDEIEEEEEEVVGLKPLVQSTAPDEIEPVIKEVPKKPKKATRTKQRTASTKKTVKSRKPSKSKKPVKPKSTAGIKRKNRGDLTEAEAEALAREDMKRMKGRPNKPIHEMSAKELIALNKKISKQNTKVRPTDAKPMPNDAQLSMHYQTQQMHQNSNPSNNGLNILVQKVLHDKKNK